MRLQGNGVRKVIDFWLSTWCMDGIGGIWNSDTPLSVLEAVGLSQGREADIVRGYTFRVFLCFIMMSILRLSPSR